MTYLEAMRLANWANEHPPAIATPIPLPSAGAQAWAVSIRVLYVNVTTDTESYDRHVVRSLPDARVVLGY